MLDFLDVSFRTGSRPPPFRHVMDPLRMRLEVDAISFKLLLSFHFLRNFCKIHLVVLISILGVWGCSKEATCPSSARNAFENALDKKPVSMPDFYDGGYHEGARACMRSFSNDPRAWDHLYGDEGQSKMKEFQKMDSKKQYGIINRVYVFCEESHRRNRGESSQGNGRDNSADHERVGVLRWRVKD